MPAENIKLLPCPFCGGIAEIMQAGTFRRSCVIGCTECHCHLESNEEGAFCGQQWNQRANIEEEIFNSKQQTNAKICPECGAKWRVTTQPGFIECGCGAWL